MNGKLVTPSFAFTFTPKWFNGWINRLERRRRREKKDFVRFRLRSRGREEFVLRFYFIAREDPLEFIVKWIADRAKGIQASSSRLMGNVNSRGGGEGYNSVAV